MLSQHNRLKRADEIANVFRRGKGFHSPFFSVKYVPRQGHTATRVAFSFGKKYLSKAVDRNRLKRMIIGELKKMPEIFLLGLDTVFFLTKPVTLEGKKQIPKAIEDFLKNVQQGK